MPEASPGCSAPTAPGVRGREESWEGSQLLQAGLGWPGRVRTDVRGLPTKESLLQTQDNVQVNEWVRAEG